MISIPFPLSLRRAGLWLAGLFVFPHIAMAQADADTLREVEVVAPLSRDIGLRTLSPVAHTAVGMPQIERLRVMDVKDLSGLVPGLHIPDYGSRMTSTVYIRGLGSRIDQPAMGVYVDGVPLMNKNTYDFPLLDVQHIAVLRGPQNTLYGRSAMGGVMDVQTLSPLSYSGTRLMVEGASGGQWRARGSVYRLLKPGLGLSVAAMGGMGDGFFDNTYKGGKADWSRTLGLNLKLEGRRGTSHWQLTSALDWVNQGGYPYRLLEEGTDRLLPVAYNDACGYHRLAWRTGFRWQGLWGGWRLSSTTSYQFSTDQMQMDQDFTPRSMFTLRQAQTDHKANHDFTLRPASSTRRWQPLTGVNLWWRRLATDAPVTFLPHGIRSLIQDNANAGIWQVFPHDTLRILEDEFEIPSHFVQHHYGLALYHHSTITLPHGWALSVGGRLEYEGQHFRYHSHSQTAYHISSPDEHVVSVARSQLQGNEQAHYVQWAPRLAATYRWQGLTLHGAVCRGFKAGGFNTQLFSDLIRQQLSQAIMQHYFAVEGEIDVRRTTRYKPEHSWNMDAGLRWERGGNSVALTAYYTDCRQQQLTVFPPGLQTGRMMANAGQSHIWGLEAEGSHTWGQVGVQYAYGYTHATFADYPDGTQNHRGCRVPYVPEHTLMAGIHWRPQLHSKHWGLMLHADVRGAGPLYWDERNTVSEPLYALLSAQARLSYDALALTLWGRNLTGTSYSTFYFVSMQNRFLQQGKPRQLGATLSWTF